MSAIAAAIGVGAVGSIVGGVMAAGAQRSAASKNRDAQKYAADLNYQQFRESRGEGGSAILPLYLKSQESRFGKDLTDAYDAYHQGPDSVAGNQNRVAAFLPAVAGARGTVNDIFSGGIEKQQLDNFAPVAKARVAFRRGAAIDALNKTLGEIDTINTKRGFNGDSFGNRLLRFNANKAAGDSVADANLANTEETRNIRDRALALKLNSLDLPYRSASNDLSLFNLPNDYYIQQLMKEQQPFQFFRIGTGQPPHVDPLHYDAIPSAGQIIAQGIGQLGGTAANYFAGQQSQQNYSNALRDLSVPGRTGGLPTGSTFASSNNNALDWAQFHP